MSDAAVTYSWTQPCCITCMHLYLVQRIPAGLIDANVELCVYCGEVTSSGIYVRIDPEEAPHPTRFKDRP